MDTGLLVACLVLGVAALILPARLHEPVASGIRVAIAPLVHTQARAEELRELLLARDTMLASAGDVATQTLTAPALREENDALRELLGLAGRLRQGFVVTEAMVTRAKSDEFVLTLTAGRDVGIVPLSPVVTADGLVGIVESVDASVSFAVTWAHPDFRASAMTTDESAFGIVQPHLAAGAERWLLELRGVPFRASLEAGTEIVTSGLGGTIPRGIPVGTVIGEIPTTERWARTYLLKPAVLPSSIRTVILLLPDRVDEGVDQVWTTVARADSAARAIAAAGDSLARVELARQTALAELRARRAVLDSLAVDSARVMDGGARGPLDSMRLRTDSARIQVPPPSTLTPRLPVVPPRTVPPDSTPLSRAGANPDSLPAALSEAMMGAWPGALDRGQS